MAIFRPDIYQKNIYSIDYDYLYNKGIRYLIIDLDNTLGFVDEKICSNKIKDFINELSKRFTIIVASNNTRKRVRRFCQGLEVIAFSEAVKPSKKVYKYFLKTMRYDVKEIAVIGDQVITDIFMGNRMKATSILIDPMGRDLKVSYVNRFLEKIVLKCLRIKRGIYYAQN